MSLGTRVRTELARRAPRLEEAVVRANWRRRNRARAFLADSVTNSAERRLLEELTREGCAVGRFEELLGNRALFDEAQEQARQLYQTRPRETETASGTKQSYLTKLAAGRFEFGHPFVRIAVHPAVLNVANGYLRLRSTLRALELWHTHPTPGAAIHTQLWHRDADDVMNVKLFVYFSNVTTSAGPLTYAPRTHPLGNLSTVPEHDRDRRSTDEQMAAVVPEPDWRVLEGPPGTIVFADTCGYHKQLKPETEERLKLVAQYVSGTPYVQSALELDDVAAGSLTDDQHYAIFDRPAS